MIEGIAQAGEAMRAAEIVQRTEAMRTAGIQTSQATQAAHYTEQRPVAPAEASGADASALQGLSLVNASATISSGRNLVADYVMGADNQLAEIRVIDPATHQVIAASPPDTIARMQQEVLAYQRVASQTQRS